MQRSAILLGSKRVRKEKGTKTKATEFEIDEDNWDYDHKLLRADEVAIADDANLYHLFGDAVYFAPQDDMLEGEPTSNHRASQAHI